MDPVLKEVLNAREIAPHFLGRLQDHIRKVIQPQLDELEALKAEPARKTKGAA